MTNMQGQTPFGQQPAPRDRIKAIAAGIFQIGVESIDLAMGPDDIDQWDSLNHLRLITEVENSFSVRLSMQQIQQIASLEDLAKLVPEGSSLGS